MSGTLTLPTGDVVHHHSKRRYQIVAQSERGAPHRVTSRDERSRALAAWRAASRLLPAHTEVWLIDGDTGEVVRHGTVAAP